MKIPACTTRCIMARAKVNDVIEKKGHPSIEAVLVDGDGDIESYYSYITTLYAVTRIFY